ncbi:rhodanese-like domain-containing protein [Carnobacteriaceae bacterium zg-ZUI252]|nr:rhodanese-like domain-containing protein [Carnobacteriaceae bacterium zg-ZUI252]MBS4770004.1 rhodanese-like domain-containing protein [Carnobacteriaceae bacterium zg-ZUI240]QTU83229.1 rhodanese-like domain-containing protein [Carnobacteriaceae bacterium zg-C25]
MSFGQVFQMLIIIFAIGYALYQIFLFVERRTSAKYVTGEEMMAAGKGIQIIDVRERDEFNRKHILGARNIPYTQFKQMYSKIRKDQPVYVYDQFGFMAGRAAGKLKRLGYKNIYLLKGGLERFEGKVKTKVD